MSTPQEPVWIVEAEKKLSKIVGHDRILMTGSCTHALEMAALLTVKAGDEVIMPSYTFVSLANAFVLQGAVPVFVDIDPSTLSINPEWVIKAITPKTKAVALMHYGGVDGHSAAIAAICKEYGLYLIEDAAHCINAYTDQGTHLGTTGHLGALSFHYTKNIHCGEGGALLINDPQLAERAAIIREKGTNRAAFLDSRVDKYTWVDKGSSYVPSSVQAAWLTAQLEKLDEVTLHLKGLHGVYQKLLSPKAIKAGCTIPALARHNGHVYYLIMKSLEERQALQAFLTKRGIGSAFHYVPLHLSPYGQSVGRFVGSDTETMRVGHGLLRLPLHTELRLEGVSSVLESVNDFFAKKH